MERKFDYYKRAFSHVRVIILALPAVFIVFLLLFPIWGKSPQVGPVGVVYVDSSQSAEGDGSSWESAFNDLQAALDNSPPGSEFWCAKGDYGNIEVGTSCEIYGGFAGGESSREERDWVLNETVIKVLLVTSDTLLDGFNFICPLEGAGVTFSNGNNSGLRNCRFNGCNSPLETIFFNGCTDPFLINCGIFQCWAGQKVPSAVISFFDCQGAVINNCSFADNVVRGAIQPILEFRKSTADVCNTILWNPGFVEIDADYNSNIAVYYSNVKDGYIGEGNIAEEPLFTFDYHLQALSPCRDAGLAGCGPEVDWEKDGRPDGNGFDIGADECVSSETALQPEEAPAPFVPSLEMDGGSPTPPPTSTSTPEGYKTPTPTPTPTPCGGHVPLFVHTTSDAWIEQFRSANKLGTMYSPWSDENGTIHDNHNKPADWNCMSDYPGYHDLNFSLYAHVIQDATPSAQTGDKIQMWYTDTEGGDTKVVWIYLPDGAEWVHHWNIHSEVTLYVDIKGNTYWDEDLCDTAYENFAPTPPPTPTPRDTYYKPFPDKMPEDESDSYVPIIEDFDQDGDLDAIITSKGQDLYYENLGKNASGWLGFADRTTEKMPVSIGWAVYAASYDFTDDSYPDVIVPNQLYPSPSGVSNNILINLGRNEQGNWLGFTDGTDDYSNFSEYSEASLYAVIADFDKSGFADVAFANQSSADRLFLNLGHSGGSWLGLTDKSSMLPNSDVATETFCFEATDLDQDGWVDLLVGLHDHQGLPHPLEYNKVYLNRQTDASGNWLGFTESQGTWLQDTTTHTNQLVAGLFDDDEYPDVFEVCENEMTCHLYLNLGTGGGATGWDLRLLIINCFR